MARQPGIVNAFGTTRQGKPGLWQVKPEYLIYL